MNNMMISLSAFLFQLRDILAPSYFFFWMILGFVLLIFEIGHPGLFLFVSFFLGALSAAAAGLYGLPFLMQCFCFLMGTFAAFILLRRWLAREQKHGYRSNVYALQGKEAVVMAPITINTLGSVKVDGELWRAQSMTQDFIPVASRVRIVSIRGTRVIVEKV